MVPSGLSHGKSHPDTRFELVLACRSVTQIIVLSKAREVLERNYPEIAAQIELHLPDEKSRRGGQAVAAASLPELNP